MFSKIALGAALMVASVSGALAWDNIGEIANPQDPVVQAPAGFDAYNAAVKQQRRMHTNTHQNMVDPRSDISNY